jgi:hypothetical protein
MLLFPSKLTQERHVRILMFGLVLACITIATIGGCSETGETNQIESSNTAQESDFNADFAFENQDPPEGWSKYSDNEFGISWYSPVKPQATRKPGNPPTVIYDMIDDSVSYMLSCAKTKTRTNGSPDAFLDALDKGTLGAMRRNGLSPELVPLGTVSYNGLIGRKTRIDMEGSSRQGIKCDLTSHDACFSLMVVGKDAQQIEEVLDLFVTSIELTD